RRLGTGRATGQELARPASGRVGRSSAMWQLPSREPMYQACASTEQFVETMVTDMSFIPRSAIENRVVPRLLRLSIIGARSKEGLCMGSDPVRGRTIRWTYDDGPMAGKSFEHVFGDDGTVTWRETGGEDKSTKPPTNGKQKTGNPTTEAKAKYEVAPINDDVCAVYYL